MESSRSSQTLCQGPSESVRHLRHQRFCHGSGVCSRGFALNTNQSDNWSNCSLSTTLSLNSLHCHYCSLTKKKLQPWRCEVTSRNGGGEPRGRSKVEGLLSQHVGRSFALGFKEQRFSTKFEELRWIKSQTLNAVVHDTESPSSGVLPTPPPVILSLCSSTPSHCCLLISNGYISASILQFGTQ